MRELGLEVEYLFWKQVEQNSAYECWPWKGPSLKNGYGQFHVLGKSAYAHRVALEMVGITIPDGMFVCHHCDNRKCCNPSHLFIGTARDNTLDMVSKGRHGRGKKPTTK